MIFNDDLQISYQTSIFIFRYVRCDEMASKAVEVVKTKELKIIPEQFEKTWYVHCLRCKKLV